jgi:putative intracellular protease/amidase
MCENDKALLAKKGITEEKLNEQLKQFETGFPFLKLSAAASIEKGILAPNEAEQTEYLQAWDSYVAANHDVVKFVPASGAASRMFKDIFAFADADYDTPQTDFEKKFFDQLPNAAFYADLNAACQRLHGKDIPALIAEGAYKAVAKAMLDGEGLNYGKLPKGLLKFHSYECGSRTPLEEHLVEGALYAKGGNGKVNVHFTVSPEHRALFEALVAQTKCGYETAFNADFNISFSEQKPSTDTVAANADNTPFRNADGSLLFRPGGHGALIENLNDIDADVVFIKNIDNVVPDRLKDDTVTYKKLLAGILVQRQAQAFKYLEKLDSGKYTMDELRDMLQFVQKNLYCKNPETKILEDTELAIYLRNKLNRPMRVCGMVRNVGEPGGGPFLAYNPDGTISLQILESSQIDMNDPEKKAMFEQGTHFNPVDLVCAIKNYKGEKFNLPEYVDKATGFISHKSKDGKELKALELPGLWNGAMSDWSTIFVEVPLSTFNPVKTVNDLYRDQHQ